MNYLNEIAIIIPSLDPDEKLLNLLKKLKATGFTNLILVNDGSSSKYRNYYEIAKDKYNCIVLTHSVNLGKGRALKNAFNYVLTELPNCTGAVTVDSDGQHSIEDIIECSIATAKFKDNLIMGCRDFSSKSENVPFRSRFGNIMTHNVLKLLCGINIPDTQTGLRGFSRKLLQTFMVTKGERFEFEMNMILDAKENNIDIKVIPIKTIYIEENKTSHFNPLKDSIKIYSVFGKFLFSSLSSFLIDISLFTFFIFLLKNMNFNSNLYILIATIFSRVISSIFNFLVNKNIVFKNKGSNINVFIKYFTLFTCQLLASAGLVTLLFNLTQINESMLKIIVDMFLFLISFKIQREWVFKNV